VALFPGPTEFVLAWGLVDRGGEVLVSAAPTTAAGDDDLVIESGEVVDEFAGVVVIEQGRGAPAPC
jgi:hypothetical protein